MAVWWLWWPIWARVVGGGFFSCWGISGKCWIKILCLIAWEELWLVVDKMLKYGDQRLFTVKLHRPFGVSVFFLWKLHKMYLRTWVALKGKNKDIIIRWWLVFCAQGSISSWRYIALKMDIISIWSPRRRPLLLPHRLFLVFFFDQVDKCLVEESSDHQVHHSLRRHLILSVMLHLMANFHCKKMDIDWYMSI